MNSIFIQLRNLQLDKLVICKKELLYMQEILSFYMANNDDYYTSKFRHISDNINNLIEKTLPDLVTMTEDNFANENEPYRYLALYEINEQKLEELVREIKLLSMKIAQNSEEYFDQYIPKALLGRRYNNKAVTDFFERYFKEVLKRYQGGDGEKHNPIVVWNFSNAYKVIHSYQDGSHSIVQNAFWYYEIPRLIPNLVHEIGHLVLDTDRFKDFKSIMKSKVSPGNIIDDLLIEEVYGDIIAFRELGISYLLSLFYTIIYNDFAKIFYNSRYATVVIPLFGILDGETLQNAAKEKILINHIRLLILIDAVLQNEEQCDEISNELKKHISKIRDFIATYVILDPTKHIDEYTPQPDTLAYRYKTFLPDHYEAYYEFCRSIVVAKNDFLEVIGQMDFSQSQNHSVIDYEKIFSEKWHVRLNNSESWHHKNDLRKDFLQAILSLKNVSCDAYELLLYKQRNDTSSSGDEPQENDTSLSGSESGNSIFQDETAILESDKLFGYFDRCKLIKKKETIGYQTLVGYLKNSSSHHKGHSYCIKYPLTLVYENNSKANDSSEPYGLILQIQAKDMKPETIRCIYERLQCVPFKKPFKIFKSLGPNDFIVICNYLSLRKIFELKKTLSKYDKIRRTSSIIYLNDHINGESQQDDENVMLYSKLRVKCAIGEIAQALQGLDVDSYYTPGPTDVTIVWKKDVSPISFYSDKYPDLIEKLQNKISDIQTFIDYRLDEIVEK